MKLQLIAGPMQFREPRTKPVDHFHKCPACGCKDLIQINPDVLCSECDWDSTAWDVSRGGMDSLFSAANEFGFKVLTLAEEQASQKSELNDFEKSTQSLQGA